MNCPYHALSEFLRGARLRLLEDWKSGFTVPFEDARRLYLPPPVA